MYGYEFISAISSFLQCKVVSGGKELVTRCRFCGDSKNPYHTHLYIKVPQHNGDISLYECKKCKTSGIVDSEFLRRYGCMDANIILEINKQINEYKKNPRWVQMKIQKHYPLNNSYISNMDLARFKLDYINSRLGTNLDIKQSQDLKIFFSLGDLLYTNRLPLTRSPETIDILSNHFVGFITHDNSRAILRKCDDMELPPNLNKRYINYTFMNDLPSATTFYVVPSTIDVSSPNPIQIHVAEGVFDILSIYINLNNMNNANNVYISASGKSYLQALEYILEITGLINYVIHVYPDKDVTDHEIYHKFIKRVSFLNNNILIHRNISEGQKDYGVSKEFIIDSVYSI